MRHVNILLLFVIFMFDYGSSCEFENEEQRYDCTSPFGISSIGTKDWTNVFLYSFTKKFNLRKDTFRRTPNLEILSLDSIASIDPGTFNGLTKLDHLEIIDSDLDEIPLGILDDLPIRSLQILRTNISEFSPGFFKELSNVREVDISENKFEEIKAEIFSDTLIYKLYFNDNQITSIEDLALSNMTYMVYLSFSENNLTTFNAKLVLGEKNGLEQLWLDKNQFTKITKNMFETLEVLKKLYIEFNQIETIEDGAFEHLPLLSYLELSNNKLKEIQPKVFPKNGMPNLYSIIIHNNLLAFLNNALFVRTPELGHISIAANPFQCPCLVETKEWMDIRNITSICDDVFFTGERPVCLFTDIEKTKCIYDVELNENLYELYTEALKDYPDLKQTCNTIYGVDNATLSRK